MQPRWRGSRWCAAGLGLAMGLPVSAALLPAGSAFVESGGVVVGEAENYHARATSANNHTWKIAPDEVITGDNANSITNARGGKYVQVLADNGGAGGGPTLPPSIEYRMNITTTGTYRLFLRWEANGTNTTVQGSSDSFFADIVELKDGAGGTIADHYELNQAVDGDFSTNPWDGDGGIEQNTAGPANNAMTWVIASPGVYTLRFSQREDGSAVDAWVFQLNSLTAPTADGPAESTIEVPEPGSIAVIGLLAVGLLRRRWK